jgi:hypothetical protein
VFNVIFFAIFCVEPIDWNMAHHLSNYLDMVKVKYRTFYIEYPNHEVLLIPQVFILILDILYLYMLFVYNEFFFFLQIGYR